MLYRSLPKSGERVSILGYGCMRFPRRAGGAAVDEPGTERLVAAAIDRGINYFDTAYLYPGSEKALGDALARLKLRGRVLVQTKLPSMAVGSLKDIEGIFERQLERLRTDYVDFYLLHHLSGFADYERLRELGIERFFERETARGRMRYAGFSYHGNVREFKRVVDAYPWELCVIQYNYLDEHFQAGTEGLRYAAGKGLGVVAMEPLKGGLLGERLPETARALLAGTGAGTVTEMGTGTGTGAGGLILTRGNTDGITANVNTREYGAARLALRWVWSHAGLVSALSGMSEERFLADNCQTVDSITNDSLAADSIVSGGIFAGSVTNDSFAAGPTVSAFSLPDAEARTVAALRECLNGRLRVPCTACAYCLPCPFGVDIPSCFALYNASGMSRSLMSRVRYVLATEGAVNRRPTKASLCKACGACEKRCPQHIAIRERLADVAREMERPWIRIPVSLALRIITKSNRKG